MESGRGRPAARFWWASALLLAALLVPLVPAAPAVAAPEETGKYYVVRPPVNGQREYLYSIALVTLGNGNRFREIIDLNRGRKQPDGATFTDGVELGPGWILMLPPDADGPGVRTGALPALGPPTRRPSPSTVPPSTPAPSPSPRETTRQPSASAGPSSSTAGPTPVVAAPGPRSGPAPISPNLVRIGAGAFAVLLAVVALLVLPRRIHQMRSTTLDDGPWPPERHRTPTPAELAGVTTPAPPHPDPGTGLGPDPDPGTGRGKGLDPDPGPEAGKHPDPGPEAGLDPDPGPEAGKHLDHDQAVLPEPSEPRTPRASPPEWPPRAGALPMSAGGADPTEAVREGTRTDAVDPPRPALPADGDVPYVRAELRTDAGPVRVRLVGVTTGPTTPAYAWLADHEPEPAAAVPLVLGRHGPWRLRVDLGRVPDVFTLVGDLDECRRLAAAYARQLQAGGVGVGVVGDALGAESLAGCRSFAGLPEPSELDSDRYVVFSAGPLSGVGIRGLAATTGGRCVPVLIGPVPDGRWSAQLGAGDRS